MTENIEEVTDHIEANMMEIAEEYDYKGVTVELVSSTKDADRYEISLLKSETSVNEGIDLLINLLHELKRPSTEPRNMDEMREQRLHEILSAESFEKVFRGLKN